MHDYLAIVRQAKSKRYATGKVDDPDKPRKKSVSSLPACEKSELSEKKIGSNAANQWGLAIRWSHIPGWIALRDPATSEWHEVKASECLPGVIEAANRARRKGKPACNATNERSHDGK